MGEPETVNARTVDAAADGGHPSVVAVVLNWRQPAATLAVLDDLGACEYPALRTRVIDNGSGDDSAAQLATRVAADASMSLDARADNVGYCAGVNAGVAWAAEQGAEFVLLLNNDVRLDPGFLAPLVATLRNDPSVGAVGPTVVDGAGRTWAEGGARAFGPNLVALHNHGGAPTPMDHGPEAVEFLPGACVLVRASVLRALGGVDEGYFMYWEDVDFGVRLRAAGWQNVWLPWVRVVHDAGTSSGGARSPLRKFMMGVNVVRFLRTHGRVRDWVAFALFECLLWPLSLASGVGAACAKARGILRGLRGGRVTVADVGRYAHGGRADG